MTSINFMPWREYRREQYRQRFFFALIFVVAISILVQWLAGYFLIKQQSIQLARHAEIKAHIHYLDQQIRTLDKAKSNHKSIVTRLDSVETLQHSRNKVTQFMNLLPTLIPEGVYVDKIDMNGRLVEINGISDSTADLATMLDRFERSGAVEEVEIHSIVSGKALFGQIFKTFKVSFVLLSTPKEGSDELARSGL
ncbi:PilN domain-containing protein [Vibrio tapetis]|uniref:Putative Tfp pilus assembly protein PilN n=1 Tax=Vibrio tapetis subsp. tapetis TaxID=1671868 RepID=A0A2N8ZG95_9VIBR|nr:PilN domain-containing protein [Vibrio tapetis]SON50934.1 putative Tfp pilus assembly protein PilN [Vibrio tapetis subsp. tapetis]